MTKLSDIRKKCIEANPEIVELKFGCEVETNKWSLKYPQATITSLEYGNDYKDISYHCAGRGESFRESEIQKIIGRSIRLADVLLAIDDESIVVMAGTGEFGEITPDGILRSGVFWNPKEPLENQSKEFLDFIHNLLDVK